MYYSVSDTGILRKKIRVLLSRVEPKTFPLLVRMPFKLHYTFRGVFRGALRPRYVAYRAGYQTKPRILK